MTLRTYCTLVFEMLTGVLCAHSEAVYLHLLCANFLFADSLKF